MKRWKKQKNRPSRAAAITLSGGVSYAQGDLGESFHRRASGRVAASLLVGPLRKSACTHSGGKPRVLFIYLFTYSFHVSWGTQAFPHGLLQPRMIH